MWMWKNVLHIQWTMTIKEYCGKRKKKQAWYPRIKESTVWICSKKCKPTSKSRIKKKIRKANKKYKKN